MEHRCLIAHFLLLLLGGTDLGAAGRGIGEKIPSRKPEVLVAPHAPKDFLPVIWRNRDGHIVRIERGNVTQTYGRGTGGRITSATSNVGGAPSFSYPENTHDAQGRRTTANTNRGNWECQYRGGENGDGQLHKAIHNGNWDFVYNTDGIGRRVTFKMPGGIEQFQTGNANDPLNQFLSTQWRQQMLLRASLDREADVEITESHALPTLLPGLPADPQLPLRDIVFPLTPPGPQGGWTAWSITGTLEGGGDPGAAPDRKAKLAGLAWFPPAQETFTYDDAGNRSSSARWLYTYDGLNRLTRAVNKSLLENDPNNNEGHEPEAWDVTFTYDAEGRRHSKTAKLYRDGALKDTTLTTWIWDGWHPVIERVIDAKLDKPIVERKLVWGPDLSGQLGGAGLPAKALATAGGAGGLLLIRETNHSFDGRPPVTIDLLPLSDGSGNIVGLANPQGDLLAEYWYGPFGELLEATGPHAANNPWRWASKSLDPETGLVYFGLRYYDPATGQWLSREPLGEGESLNLYAYCHNDPINRVDVLGAAEAPVHAGNLALAEQMIEDGASALGYWSSIESVLPSAMPMGMMAPDVDGGHRPILQKEYEVLRMISGLRDTGSMVLPPELARTYVSFGADLAWLSKFHLNRFDRQAAFLEEAGGFAPGSIDPLQAGEFFDETNPDFQVSESRAFWLSLNPARTTALHFHHGRTARGFLSYGIDVAAWSAFSMGGEFISTGRVGFSSGFRLTGNGNTSLWQGRFPGVEVRKIGSHWVKRPNPKASRFFQEWGQRTIEQQSSALARLHAAGRPAANFRLTSSGRIIVEDVGTPLSRWQYFDPAYWSARGADARALGGASRIFNDLRPGNYGAGFRAFDPALDPGVGVLGIGGGAIISGGALWWTFKED